MTTIQRSDTTTMNKRDKAVMARNNQTTADRGGVKDRNTKNQHVFPKDGGWMVRNGRSKNISRLFEDKNEAMEYAGIIASNEGGMVVTHKYNGQFKDFRSGDEIHVRTHKIACLITGAIEIKHPIVNNIDPVIQTMTLA